MQMMKMNIITIRIMTGITERSTMVGHEPNFTPKVCATRGGHEKLT